MPEARAAAAAAAWIARDAPAVRNAHVHRLANLDTLRDGHRHAFGDGVRHTALHRVRNHLADRVRNLIADGIGNHLTSGVGHPLDAVLGDHGADGVRNTL